MPAALRIPSLRPGTACVTWAKASVRTTPALGPGSNCAATESRAGGGRRGTAAALALAPHVRRSEPERFQEHEAGVLDPLMVVGDREVTEVVHFPRGHAASAGLDHESQPFWIGGSQLIGRDPTARTNRQRASMEPSPRLGGEGRGRGA